MNCKQKLGYMALGAGILALGIIIGQFVTPDIEAQDNGVFDKIQCRGLEVLDTEGKAVIVLAAHDVGNAILVNGVHDKPAIALMADKKGGVSVRAGEQSGLVLISDEIGNRMIVSDDRGEPAIVFRTRDDEHGIFVYDKQGEQAVTIGHDQTMNAVHLLNEGEISARLSASKVGSSIGFYDKKIDSPAVHVSNYDDIKGVTILDEAGRSAVSLTTSDMGNGVRVFDQTGGPAISLYADEARNAIDLYDKAGNRKWSQP